MILGETVCVVPALSKTKSTLSMMIIMGKARSTNNINYVTVLHFNALTCLEFHNSKITLSFT